MASPAWIIPSWLTCGKQGLVCTLALVSQMPVFGHFLCHLPLGLAMVGHEDGHGVKGVAGRWRRVITLGWRGMITRAPSCQHSAV